MTQTREDIMHIYEELKTLQTRVDQIKREYQFDDTFTPMDFMRISGSVENCIEVYEEVLGVE